jgi:hypothetical protein
LMRQFRSGQLDSTWWYMVVQSILKFSTRV